MKKYIVGTNHTGYLESRNFYSLPFENFKFKKFYDWCKIIDHLNFRLKNQNHLFCHNFHNDILIPCKPDLYHFFHTVSATKRPWIVTHSGHLPRYIANSAYKTNIEKGFKVLAGINCKKIISICNNSKNYLMFSLEQFPQYKEA